MSITNKVMLITYPDSLGKNIKELEDVLEYDLNGAVGGIHLLPFFPSTGDRGFAPTDYTKVDPKFGNWSDIENLSKKNYLMFDFMINHISRHSKYYKDFKKNKIKSPYKDLFLSWDKFWPKGRPTQKDIHLIYKRKNKAPYQEITFKDGSKEKLWNTFGAEQIDLDIRKKVTQKFIKTTLNQLIEHGADIIRLDAFAYAVKKLDTNDFFVEPEIWNLLEQVQDDISSENAIILPEIHEHYSMPFKLSKHGYFIYDFVLPMVTLYSLYSGRSNRLVNWINKSPMKQFTTLDTHDGIGVVDARDVLTPKEIKYTSEELYKVGANVKKKYSSSEYHNLDIYQINSTFYSALGDDDKKYFMARLLQIFAPGIPQVYYVGMLAGKNDIDLLEKTKEGRNINRHYYSRKEVSQEVKRPVVQALLNLFKFRNTHPAFDLNGSEIASAPNENEIEIIREDKSGSHQVKLHANLEKLTYDVTADNKKVEF